jgi:hypothetical protein
MQFARGHETGRVYRCCASGAESWSLTMDFHGHYFAHS